MTYTLRILPAADADVDAAGLYIARDNVQAALRFFGRAVEIIRVLHGARNVPAILNEM